MKTYNKLILFLLMLIYSNSYAQIEEIFSARDDAQTYLNYYMSPAMNGIMYNLNNGWYSTGKTHDKWGFDITINATASMIPDEDKSFVFIATDYHNLALNGSNPNLPTVAGSETNAMLTANYNGYSYDFNAIDGVGDEWPQDFFIPIAVPTPMVQVGLGIPSKTDVKLRYTPPITNNELKFDLVGIGLQHDLTQHFKIFEKIPTLHISALAAFTNTNLTYTPKNQTVTDSNQHIEMKINAYTLQLIGDIDLKLVNFYLGMGYTKGDTNLNALGTFQYDYNDNGSFETDEKIIDPLKMKFNIDGFKTTLGMRINMGPMKLFFDYSLQKYPSISTGLGISIR